MQFKSDRRKSPALHMFVCLYVCLVHNYTANRARTRKSITNKEYKNTNTQDHIAILNKIIYIHTVYNFLHVNIM